MCLSDQISSYQCVVCVIGQPYFGLKYRGTVFAYLIKYPRCVAMTTYEENISIFLLFVLSRFTFNAPVLLFSNPFHIL